MIDIDSIVGQLEQHINSHTVSVGAASYMGTVSYILEFRTIGLRLPRESGKTKFLLNKFYQTNSMLIVSNHHIASYCKKQVRSQLHDYIQVCHSGASNTIAQKFIGKRNAKLQYLLIDEAVVQSDLIELLSALQLLKMIDDMLTIIQLQT